MNMNISNDVILNKITNIENCLRRIQQIKSRTDFDLKNYDIQDALVLNLQRACQASIDLALHVCKRKKLGPPQESVDAFRFLMRFDLIPEEIIQRMEKMVGFRNIAIHEYQSLNLSILESIINKHLQDFTDFTEAVFKII